MKKIKAFLYVVKNSLTSLKYYGEVVSASFSFSLKYFFALATIAVLAVSIPAVVRVTPEIKKGVNVFFTQVKEIYPKDLEIWTEGGEWKINQPEPYVIKLPEKNLWKDLFSMPEGVNVTVNQKLPSNLVVFHKEGTINDLEKLDTFILVNKANIVVKGDNKVEVYPLKDLPQTSPKFTYMELERVLIRLEKYAEYLPYIVLVFIVLATAFHYMVLGLVYLAFVALILLLVGAITKANLNYNQAFRVGIHTSTLPLLIELITMVVGFNIKFPLWYFLVNIIFGILVIASLSRSKGSVNEITEGVQSAQPGI